MPPRFFQGLENLEAIFPILGKIVADFSEHWKNNRAARAVDGQQLQRKEANGKPPLDHCLLPNTEYCPRLLLSAIVETSAVLHLHLVALCDNLRAYG